MIEIHQGKEIIKIEGNEEGAKDFNERMKKYIEDGGGYICSSSIDFPRDYGVSWKIIDLMFEDLK